MRTIEPGSKVVVRTADGEKLPRRAITGVEAGNTFEVVWVCKEDEWSSANNQGRQADGIPWPAEAVELDRQAVTA